MMAMPEPPEVTNIHPRAYQLEMLEESLKRNIIVAVSKAMRLRRCILTINRWALEVGRLKCRLNTGDKTPRN
jgi:hypothetical protein